MIMDCRLRASNKHSHYHAVNVEATLGSYWKNVRLHGKLLQNVVYTCSCIFNFVLFVSFGNYLDGEVISNVSGMTKFSQTIIQE